MTRIKVVRVQTGKWNARLEERSLHNVCLMLTICVVLLSALPAPLLHGVQDRARLAGLTVVAVPTHTEASQLSLVSTVTLPAGHHRAGHSQNNLTIRSLTQSRLSEL